MAFRARNVFGTFAKVPRRKGPFSSATMPSVSQERRGVLNPLRSSVQFFRSSVQFDDLKVVKRHS